ncbi:MAG: PQQ-dependent sugar dehydrogenase [Pirellulales bacterium]
MRQSIVDRRSQSAACRRATCVLLAICAGAACCPSVSIAAEIGAVLTNPNVLTDSSLFGDWQSKMYTGLQRAQGWDNSMFMSRADGKIYRVDLNTNTQSLFYQLPAGDYDAGGQYYGVLGFTFSPDFANNGKLYVHVADDLNAEASLHHRIYIREYTLNNPLSATPTLASQKNILRWDQRRYGSNADGADHSGGWLGFQPDNPNILWILGGDGGNSETGQGAGNNPSDVDGDGIRSAQDKDDLLGSLLRVDVSGDEFFDSNYNFRVPTDNPNYNPGSPDIDPNYATDGLNDAIWTYGNRSPWGASFDRATGDFIWGEVGQATREEVNFQRKPDVGGYGPLGGRNYGWRVMEADVCWDRAEYAGNECNSPGSPPLSEFTDPFHTYLRGGGYGSGGAQPFRGRAVTGGYIYRGPIAELQGKYIYGDSSSHQIWSIGVDRDANGGLGGVVGSPGEDLSQELALNTAGGSDALFGVTAFGEDVAGNLYYLLLGGQVFKIISMQPTATWNINAGGNWASLGSWSSSFGAVPNANNHNVVFAGIISAAHTVYTDANVTAKSMTFANANKYAVGGGGTITLAADTGNSSIIVTLGSHEIQAALALGSDTDVSAAAGTRLDIGNSVNLNGRTMSVSGQGQVFLHSNLNTANGTVNNTGKLGGHGRINGALNNNGGTIMPGSSIGTLTVETTFTQNAAGILSVEISGNSVGDYDQLVVEGAATLDGSVAVALVGFTPSAGDVFTILTAASVTDNGIEMAGAQPSPYYLMTGSGTSLLLGVGAQGDFNHDGTVNAADYTVWRNELGQSVANGTSADADGSGTVTRDDYNIWKSQYGQTAIPIGSGSGQAVPEPGSCALLLAGVALAVCGAARRRAGTPT